MCFFSPSVFSLFTNYREFYLWYAEYLCTMSVAIMSTWCACTRFPSPFPMAGITDQSGSCSAHYSQQPALITWSQCGGFSLPTIVAKQHFDKSVTVLPAEYRLAPCVAVTPLGILFPVMLCSQSLAFLLGEGWKNFEPLT